MNETISYCGLICKSCTIYLASREPDKFKKQEMISNVIGLCKEHYGIDYNYDDINDCDGCKSVSGKIFFGCSNCKIRKCAIEKGIDNCAYCSEYACNDLLELFKTDSYSKARLDGIRKNISEMGHNF